MVHPSPLAFAAGLLALATPAAAQASFFEGFEGKSLAALESEGWSFRNQSTPLGPLGWYLSSLSSAYEGSHYLATDGNCMGSGSTKVGSNWALLPDVGQVAGEDLVLGLAEGWSLIRSDVLEVRYSPSGGTSTGSSPQDLGDFTVLLAEFPHETLGGWSLHAIELPGPGRIALRWYVPTGDSGPMYVDAVSVGTPPSGAVPLPAPGETVVWSSAISPVTLQAGTTQVPAGGHVVVEPSVAVVLPPGATLRVEGSIEFGAGSSFQGGTGAELELWYGGAADFQGTAAAPVRFEGDHDFGNPALAVNFGSRATLTHVELEAWAKVTTGSIAALDACTLASQVTGPTQQAGFRVLNATLAMRDSTLVDARLYEEGGYLLLDRNTLDASVLELERIDCPQTLLLDNLVATGNAAQAPIVVRRFDVLLGENNLIQGNLAPVRLESGGLAPGSVVPAGGNQQNVVSALSRVGSRSTWSDVGLPYVVDWDPQLPSLSGSLTIEPGVTARFRRGQNTTADAFWFQQFAHLIARGTAERPIVLTDDGDGWAGVFFGNNDSKRPKLEHVVVERADIGVTAQLCRVGLESVTLRDNLVGANSNSFGQLRVRGTRVLDNGVGVQTSNGSGGSSINAGRADLDGAKNPNTLDGNGAGLQVLNTQVTVDATDNWWGAASGPQHPSNPGGTGDSATASAVVKPFLTAPPPVDAPPRVSLLPLGDVLEEGTTVIVSWDAEDDVSIVAQRIEYSPHGGNPPLAPLAVLPPDARSYTLVVPQSPPSSNTALPVLRVVAVDDLGQEGWDEAWFLTPYQDFELEFEVDDMPPVVRPGEILPVCWSIAAGDAFLLLDDVGWAVSLGGTTTSCTSLGLTVPGVSTDLARIAVAHTVGAGGRVRYEYSDYFSIRPDPLLGDAPPTVALSAPLAGSFAPGGTVPISWTAADDEGLRSFTLQTSCDGGRGWNVLARDLPGTARSFDWELPEDQSLPQVLLRVVATDLRFQTSSDTASIQVGPGPVQHRVAPRAPAAGAQTKP